MNRMDAVLVGAGQRGRDVFGGYARTHPDRLRFVAVADPHEGRRNRFADEHAIPTGQRFAHWEDLFARPRLAEACFNATMDRMHRESALAALDAGYHLMLEKPMADTPAGCLELEAHAQARGLLLQICHPLRYTPFYTRVKEVLASGRIGRIVSLTMHENVGYWHFAHSYVRGNWRRLDESGPMILTKCCHDMDIAAWLVDAPVHQVSSFGSLRTFRAENAPEGAPARCTDGCPVEASCPFFAPAFYMGAGIGWPTSTISVDTSLEARRRALETERYGRCVFRCDNDVVDNQAVTAEFMDGTVFDFFVRSNSVECFRTIRVVGERGELNGHFEKNEMLVSEFGQGYSDKARHEVIRTAVWDGGHGGGDVGAIGNFLRCLDSRDRQGMAHSLRIAVEGHLLAFAAEQARVERRVVTMDEFRTSLGR
jgi:predicted dehydrogenase